MSEPATQPLEPLVVRSDEGEARWWFESLTVIRATADYTGGLTTIVEMTEPPGHEAPLHVHHREDEAFYILDGSATIEVGDTSFEVGPGELRLRAPRHPDERAGGAPHPAAAADEEPDWEQVAAVGKANGCELLA